MILIPGSVSDVTRTRIIRFGNSWYKSRTWLDTFPAGLPLSLSLFLYNSDDFSLRDRE